MKIHNLKCWPEYFEAIAQGRKTFEIRYDDRAYETGDVLFLREYSPFDKTYSGREIQVQVEYMQTWRGFGLLPGWVVMAIRPYLAGDFSH